MFVAVESSRTAGETNMDDSNKTNEPIVYYTSVGLSLGLSFGVAFGAAFDDVGTGLSLGMVLGLVIGAGIGASVKKKQDTADEKRINK